MNLGRWYFALQAVAGTAWWAAVFLVPAVRTATLGSLNPIAVAVVDVPFFVIASALAAAGIRVGVWVVSGWTLLVTGGLAAYATITGEAGWGVLLMIAAAAGSVCSAFLVLRGRIPTEWAIVGPFAFRISSRSSARGYFGRTLGEIAVFWGLCLVVIPFIIAFFERRWRLDVPFPWWMTVAGLVILLLASALGIWSAYVMSTRGEGTPLPAAMPRHLVIAGPYRFVRNPMAISGIVQGAAVGLIMGSWLVVVYAVLGSAVWNWVVRPHEEADLAARFGDEFTRYRQRVRCWVPRLRMPLPRQKTEDLA